MFTCVWPPGCSHCYSFSSRATLLHNSHCRNTWHLMLTFTRCVKKKEEERPVPATSRLGGGRSLGGGNLCFHAHVTDDVRDVQTRRARDVAPLHKDPVSRGHPTPVCAVAKRRSRRKDGGRGRRVNVKGELAHMAIMNMVVRLRVHCQVLPQQFLSSMSVACDLGKSKATCVMRRLVSLPEDVSGELHRFVGGKSSEKTPARLLSGKSNPFFWTNHVDNHSGTADIITLHFFEQLFEPDGGEADVEVFERAAKKRASFKTSATHAQAQTRRRKRRADTDGSGRSSKLQDGGLEEEEGQEEVQAWWVSE